MTANNFFRQKRSWSKYKDFILGYYLDPYIPKVAKLNKPILIVDCFAGCGMFDDGQSGSPLIIAQLIKKWSNKGIEITGEFIEADPTNFERLSKSLEEFTGLATPRYGIFDDHLSELATRAKHNTVFLYVDPYTVKGLVFDRMKAVYDQIRKSSSSVELLLNLNVATFMRWALAALKRHDAIPLEATDQDADYQADDPNESIELATLDGIAGGSYWRSIAYDDTSPFTAKLDAFTTQYQERLRSSFPYVASCEIKSKYEHQVPKYALIYATRHPDGVELMNDGMCKARRDFLGDQFAKGRLFDFTPEEELTNLDDLCNDLQSHAQGYKSITRKMLRNRGIWSDFGRYQSKDFNSAIATLLKSGRLFSKSGKTRINDQELLSATAFGDAQALS